MGEKKKDVPTVWFSLKKSLHCKSEPSDVHSPKTRKQLSAILTRKTGRNSATPPRKTASLLAEREGNGVPTQKRASFEKIVMGLMELHATNVENITELVEGDSSRKIVEIICRSSWLKSENHCVRIDRVLKVHNMQKTLARFEDYRETVKIRPVNSRRSILAA
ncbi:UNVERIFIED_CONTAM: hypothetical protein Sradi_6060200 [Sesamum radiatum]|uniref:Uncharacterized protein n=1 Tax=Sesamum radiatum TaxID=300843 RepID=A0AAW2KJG6_SESRA